MKSLILVSNDDGIEAPGLRALVEALGQVGQVWAVAPDGERSTSSHSLTLREDVAAWPVGERQWAVQGWPADSVYIALFGGILPRRPDLVVSGINLGPNLGTDVVYSGTVGAAREALTRGIPSMAVSLVDGEDFTTAASFAAELARHLLASGRTTLLNVNVPAGAPRGVRVAGLGRHLYPERAEVTGRRGEATLYRIGGGLLHDALLPGTDGEASAAGYITVTPLGLDSVARDDLDAAEALCDRALEGLELAGGAGTLDSRSPSPPSRAARGEVTGEAVITDARVAKLTELIRDVPDFPKEGIVFKDITTLLKDSEGLKTSVDLLVEKLEGTAVDCVVAMESRGFIFGTPVAARIGAGFVPVRKPGKLPAETVAESYELEYGTDTLEIHKDGIAPGMRVAIIDDLLATGGTAEAAVRLVRALGGEVVATLFVIELDFLEGRKRLEGVPVESLIHY